LAKAHGWWRRMESGHVKSITDFAEQEGVMDAFLCRLLPLTCLAPEVVAAILDGRDPNGIRVAEMLGSRPLVTAQRRRSSSSAARCLAHSGRALTASSQTVPCVRVSFLRYLTSRGGCRIAAMLC
jgi:hypothetical protein